MTVHLANCGVKDLDKVQNVEVKVKKEKLVMKPVTAHLANCGVRMQEVEVQVKKEKLVMKPVTVTLTNIEGIVTDKDDVADEDDLENIFDETLTKEVPEWAVAENYIKELTKQEEYEYEILEEVFAPIDVRDLDDVEMFKVTPKVTKPARNYSLNLDLTDLTFSSWELEMDL